MKKEKLLLKRNGLHISVEVPNVLSHIQKSWAKIVARKLVVKNVKMVKYAIKISLETVNCKMQQGQMDIDNRGNTKLIDIQLFKI